MFSAELLLNPISVDQPCGIDLAFSAEMDAIAQARRFDDASLDQGEWVTELKEADWAFVAARCAALLADTSKDLRLGVWLAEAGAKRHHLRGLGEGFRVLAGLCDQYWQQGLFPLAEDDGQEQRIGILSWILGRTPALVREVPLTESRHGAYSSIDFERARKLAMLGEAGKLLPGPKLADLDAARRANSIEFNDTFGADARYCMEALMELERAADSRLGSDSPGFAAARDAVQGMLRSTPAAGAGLGTAAEAAPVAAVLAPGGVIQTRAQALQQLRQVAQFFRRTEPHSPASYFADKAADAGEQSLHVWLRTVLKDPGAIAHIEELLGVPPPA